jgi:hypothetical protein
MPHECSFCPRAATSAFEWSEPPRRAEFYLCPEHTDELRVWVGEHLVKKGVL